MKENNHFINGAYLVMNLTNIIESEKDLESMLYDDILNIFVDSEGTFHYQVTDKYYDRLKSMNAEITRKTSTFKDMCNERGIDMNVFDRFYKKN